MEYYEHKLDPVGTRPEWLSDDVSFGFKCFGQESSTYDDWDLPELENLYSWDEIENIRIPADHWAVPALKQGFKPCREKPADYDGGETLWSNGCVTEEDENLGKRYWSRYTGYKDGYVIGYKPNRSVRPEPEAVYNWGEVKLEWRATEVERLMAIIERIASNGVASITDVRECEAIVAERRPVDPLIALFDEIHGEQCMEGETWPEKMAKLTRFLAAKHNLKIVEA